VNQGKVLAVQRRKGEVFAVSGGAERGNLIGGKERRKTLMTGKGAQGKIFYAGGKRKCGPKFQGRSIGKGQTSLMRGGKTMY